MGSVLHKHYWQDTVSLRFSDETAKRCFNNWRIQDCLLAAGLYTYCSLCMCECWILFVASWKSLWFPSLFRTSMAMQRAQFGRLIQLCPDGAGIPSVTYLIQNYCVQAWMAEVQVLRKQTWQLWVICTYCVILYGFMFHILRKPAGRLGVVSPCERSEN